jgi:hypothetical protein
MVESSRPQMIIWRICVTRWIITKAKDILGMDNTYCFYTTTMVAQTRLQVTLSRTLPVFSLNIICSVADE